MSGPLNCGQERAVTATSSLPLFLTVNNCFEARVSVAVGSAGPAPPVRIVFPVAQIAENARRYDDYYELLFVVTEAGPPGQLNNLFAVAILPWGTQHYLGPFTASPADATSARLVAVVPEYIDIVVRRDTCVPDRFSPPSPSEMLLKEHVKTLLENDEFCGSVPRSHVQNIVRDLPFYMSGMRRFKKWAEFVDYFASYYHCWSLVTYTEGEHWQLRLTDLIKKDEIRMVANRCRSTRIAGDILRDEVKSAALNDLRGLIVATREDSQNWDPSSRAGPFTLCKEVINVLAPSSSFMTLNCINYLQVLKDASSRNAVLFSPLHPVQMNRWTTPERTFSSSFLFGVKMRQRERALRVSGN